MIPGERKPSELFARLFLTGNAGQVEAQVRRLREGRSLLDSVGDRARGLEQRLGSADREKLDEYLTGVRELERRMHLAEEWERKPKPVVQAAPPKDIADNAEMIGRTRLMFQVAQLALQTDSTRLVTMLVDQAANAKTTVPGVTQGTHTLSHHGNSPDKLAEIRLIEEAQFREFRTLLEGLQAFRENGKTLLDQTMVLYGTQFGNTSSHSNINMPVLLAGGGLRHAGHLAFDRVNNYPLCNLYVTILQRLGVDAGRFASSTGTMRGLT